MTVTYTDNQTSEFVVIANEAASVATFSLKGTVRSVEVNQDGAALAIIEKK